MMNVNNRPWVALILSNLIIQSALAAETDQSLEAESLEVITVTARKVAESLQHVPDAVTAFGRQDIASARIDDINDFAKLTPNLLIRDGFRAGVSYVTLRGITTPQQGLPPVTYVVDGVQVGALDFINQDLNNIERIEILRGPQGALYGAGAMAGAINIITKAPTEVWGGDAKLQIAQGNETQFRGTISGGISDYLFASFNTQIQQSDGLIDSSNGEDLDFNDNQQFSSRWQFLGEQLTADLRLSYSDYEQGAITQDLLAVAPNQSPSDINLDDFNNGGPERGFIGEEQRTFRQGSLKLGYQFEAFDLTWISAHNQVDQHLIGDLDWSATPIFLQDLTDNFEVTSHELRLSSNQHALRWLFGAYYQKRDALNDLTIRLEPEAGTIGPDIFSQIDVKSDTFNALFGQFSYDLSTDLELTLAARYDQVEYSTTRFAERALSTVVPLPDETGTARATLTEKDSEFQPKVSLSYDVSANMMTYATYAEGFRPGFYNSGNLTRAEFTKNYEIGFKSTLADGKARLNSALFFIDYSDQQFSSIIAEPPFRVTSNIPKTRIRGAELEATWLLQRGLKLNFGYGYTDAEVDQLGIQAPSTPKNTANLSLQHEYELTSDWQWQNRFDYRYQSDINLGSLALPLKVSDKHFFNISTVLENQQWRVDLFVENLTDEQTATEASYVEGLLGVVTGVIRRYTPGRKAGLEVTYQF